MEYKDLKSDLFGLFEDSIRRGVTPQEASDQLLAQHVDLLDDTDDGVLFWAALAETLWSFGYLDEDVKSKALSCMDELPDEELTSDLKKCRQKICSPMRKPKKRSPYRFYRCPWQIGDVFLLSRRETAGEDQNIQFLIQKIGEKEMWPGHITPIVYVKMATSIEVPLSLSAYNALHYLRTGATRFEFRFLPFDHRRSIEEQMAERANVTFYPDKNGLLVNYRIQLGIESKRDLPGNLIYLGNYRDAVPPPDEYIPFSSDNIPLVLFRDLNAFLRDRYLCYEGNKAKP